MLRLASFPTYGAGVSFAVWALLALESSQPSPSPRGRITLQKQQRPNLLKRRPFTFLNVWRFFPHAQNVQQDSIVFLAV
jgi:hypothetical protein